MCVLGLWMDGFGWFVVLCVKRCMAGMKMKKGGVGLVLECVLISGKIGEWKMVCFLFELCSAWVTTNVVEEIK